MILIIGSNGQLGRQMQKAFTGRDIPFFALDYPEVDITQMESVQKLVEGVKPQTVINCAAYTNVDKAEAEEEVAYQVNAVGPKNIAEVCREKDIELVHISTDYVFSGTPCLANGRPRPYVESDVCDPKTAYGRTKLQGERFVQDICNKYYILRTAWLYGEGTNFIRTMLQLAQTHDTIRVVDDQIGSPTSTVDLANAICSLTGSGAYGLYHATCEGQCSWYEFACRIFKLKQMDIKVLPVTSEEFVRPAKRPAWSVLENAALKQIGKNSFRSWDEALCEYLGI
ncbi:MAG: dTDP-4-dehydrorhamnose reductase [Christensenellales bacterium]